MRAPRLTDVAPAALAVVGTTAALYGIGIIPEPRPGRAPAVTPLSAVARKATEGQTGRLARNSAERRAKRLTLPVRNVSCLGVATGSGFALDHHTVITNRHVLAGADAVELNTWDGVSLNAPVDEAKTGRLVDIGIAVVHRWRASRASARRPSAAIASPPWDIRWAAV